MIDRLMDFGYNFSLYQKLDDSYRRGLLMSNQQDYHNSGGLFALLGSIIFVFAFFFYIIVIHQGIDLAENISEPLKAGEVQFDLAAAKDPWIATDDIVKAGAKIFKQNCAVCHGTNGDLVGGIAAARNLVEGKWTQGGGLIAQYKVLQTGIAGTQMVSFKAQLKPFERWAVLHFVESITKNKSTDKPGDVAAFAASAD